MLRALDDYVVHGVQTGIGLHRRILEHPAFVAGDVTTAFLDEHPEVLRADEDIADDAFVAAALAETLRMTAAPVVSGDGQAPLASAWNRIGAWEIGGGA
jgi:pyruvate carboxylase